MRAKREDISVLFKDACMRCINKKAEDDKRTDPAYRWNEACETNWFNGQVWCCMNVDNGRNGWTSRRRGPIPERCPFLVEHLVSGS